MSAPRIFLPKIVKVCGNLTEVLTKTNLLSFFGTLCRCLFCMRNCKLSLRRCKINSQVM